MPPSKLLPKIAEALGVSIEELISTDFSYLIPTLPIQADDVIAKAKQQLANNLRTLRFSKGYSQDELGEILGCTGTAIYEWEKKGGMSLDSLFKVSIYFGFSITDLCYEDLSKKELVTN